MVCGAAVFSIFGSIASVRRGRTGEERRKEEPGTPRVSKWVSDKITFSAPLFRHRRHYYANDLVRLKVAPLHPLLRRSATLAYTRRWWSILAMGAQSAAIDCILGRDPQVWVPHGEPPLATVLADADIAPEPSRIA